MQKYIIYVMWSGPLLFVKFENAQKSKKKKKKAK